jgi:hypothetical protein
MEVAICSLKHCEREMLCPKAPPDSPKEAIKEARETPIRTGIKATLLVHKGAE